MEYITRGHPSRHCEERRSEVIRVTWVPGSAESVCSFLLLRASEGEMALQMDLNKDRYVSLLEKLIGEVEFLQNSPPKFIPQEDK